MADKVADGNEVAVASIHPNVCRTTVSALTALQSRLNKGELYIDNQWVHPKAIHGIMDAIHEKISDKK